MNVPHLKHAALAAMSVVVLSACSATSAVGNDGYTLAQTKSPVQLLRNDAASRVDETVIASARGEIDGSAACLDEFDNPDGIVRQWISGIELVLTEEADLTAVSDALVATFVVDGWEQQDLSSGKSFALTILSTESSVAQVQIEASAESDGGLIRVTSTGPCVTTDGPDSDEVHNLEAG
jgi:hypothetical protein